MLGFFRKNRTGVVPDEEANVGRRGACGFAGIRAQSLQEQQLSQSEKSKNHATVVKAGGLYGVAVAPSTKREIEGFQSAPSDIAASVRATAAEIREHPVHGIVNAGLRWRVMPTPEHGLTPSETSNYGVAFSRGRDNMLAAGKVDQVRKNDERVFHELMNGAYGNPYEWMRPQSNLGVTISTGPTAIQGNQLIHTSMTTEAAPAGDALDQFNEQKRAYVQENLEPEMKVATGDGISLPLLDNIVEEWNNAGSDKPMLWMFFHQRDGRVKVHGVPTKEAAQYDNCSVDELHRVMPMIREDNKSYISMHAQPGDSVTCYPSAMVNHWLRRRYQLESDFDKVVRHHIASGDMLPGAAGIHEVSGASISGSDGDSEYFNPAFHVACIAEALASPSESAFEDACTHAGDLFGKVTGTAGRVADKVSFTAGKVAGNVVDTAGTITGKVGNVPSAVFGTVSQLSDRYLRASEAADSTVISKEEYARRTAALRSAGFNPDEIAKAMEKYTTGIYANTKTARTRSGDAFLMEDGRMVHPQYTMLLVMDGYRDADARAWLSGKHGGFLAKFLRTETAAELKKAIKKMSKERMRAFGLGVPKKPAYGLTIEPYIPANSTSMIGRVYLASPSGFDLNKPVAHFYQLGFWVYATQPTQIVYCGENVTLSQESRIWINHIIAVKENGAIDHFMSWSEMPGKDKEAGLYCNVVHGTKPTGFYTTSRKTAKKPSDFGGKKKWKSSEVTMFAQFPPSE